MCAARLKKFHFKNMGQNESFVRYKKKELLIFCQNELLYNVQCKERKNMAKKLQRFEMNMGQRYKILHKEEKD